MIRQTKYNKINCIGCGEATEADLVAFDFSKVFMEAIRETASETEWSILGYLDLKFYYTLRDICQELAFEWDKDKPTELRLRVRHVIQQIEFLLNEIPFEKIKNETRNSVLYNSLYENTGSTFGTADEKMEAIEQLISSLDKAEDDIEIVSVKISLQTNRDEDGNEIPAKLYYYINDEERELQERVCPMCGMPIDNQAGYRNEYIIGLAGLARVGKTALIAALLHQLKQLDSQGYIRIKEDTSESLQLFEKEIVSEYERGNVIRKTEVENTDAIPLVYLPLQIGNREYNFIFVDMPGEIYSGSDMEGLDFISNKRTIMKNADVVWCCVEPTMFHPKYANKNVVAKKDDSSKQLSSLIRVMNMIYNIKVPASIVVTQTDRIDDYPLYLPHQNVFDEYLLDDHSLDLEKTKEFEEKTKEFINQMNNFTLSIEDTFEGFSMFGVSSYGFDVSGKAVITNQKIQPSMVELPFLWTLAKLKLIKTTKLSTAKDFFGKEKIVAKDVENLDELYINK